MTSIYLSSTHEDLKEHRRVVWDALVKSGYQVITMEDYVATDQRPVEKCLKDVAASDIYVGIFAFRYGYVPSTEHNNPKGLSITELEYRQAERLKKPCLLFVLREKADWPVDFNDAFNAKDKGDHIRRFREYLLTEKMAEYFSSPHELAALVLASVTRVQPENKNTEEAKNQKTETPPAMTRSHLPIRGTMSDIFISYKREEQPEARKLANALERERWSVWWDPKLRAGEHFDEVIEQALKESKCVVVMWSKLSVNSRYVKDEATYALNRRKLVPVAIEQVELPFRFEGIHTPSLRDWDGADDFPEFRKLVEDIKAILSEPAHKTPKQQAPKKRRRISPRPKITVDSREPGTVFRDTLKDGSSGPEMIVLPAGTFQMGDRSGEDDEKPVHTVHIRKPFALGRYQVTFDQYDYYAKLTERGLPKDEGWGRGRRPAINVSWNNAVEYTTWLSAQTDRCYRLPTEAEWEYAARSGGKNETWAGTSKVQELGDYSVFDKNQPEPVGSRKPNALGLYDMSGNVWEWVEDCWHENYDSAPADGSAWLQAGQRVIRGGSWNSIAGYLRSSFRYRDNADNRNKFFGFRLARDLP